MFREEDKKGIFLPTIVIQDHPQKGWICVAAADIPLDTLIERCPTIKISAGALDDLFQTYGGRTILHDYTFCKSARGFSYWAMGYGGIYSHSNNPNARWKVKSLPNGKDVLEIRAIKDIKKGEEITQAYVPIDKEDEYLWFDPIE